MNNIIKLIETNILKQIMQYLKLRGILAWRNNTGAISRTSKSKTGSYKTRYIHFGLKGQADITGILRDGRRLEIEVKRPDYLRGAGIKQRLHFAQQQKFLETIRQFRGVAGRACNIEDVEMILAGKEVNIL